MFLTLAIFSIEAFAGERLSQAQLQERAVLAFKINTQMVNEASRRHGPSSDGSIYWIQALDKACNHNDACYEQVDAYVNSPKWVPPAAKLNAR
jgi:hypothetical protein